MWHYGFFWGFPFFPLFGFLFWFLIIALFFRWGKWGNRHYWHDHLEKSAEEILKQRFAHGEINEKEFKERMNVLNEHSK